MDEELLKAFGVTREEIEALDPDGSYERARRQAREQYEAMGEYLKLRYQKIMNDALIETEKEIEKP